MEKITGLVQLSRPEDYRPYLKDDVFEDIIADMFQTADATRDGYIDENDFYTVRNLIMIHCIIIHVLFPLMSVFAVSINEPAAL
jgi:hypothetical protein